jgi:hypothetical protein
MNKKRIQNMFKIFLLLVVIIGITITSNNYSPVYADENLVNIEPGEGVENHLAVISASADGVILEFTAPRPSFEENVVNAERCQTVSIPGLAQNVAAGEPSLPVKGAMLGIPQEGQPSLQILDVEMGVLPGAYHLCPSQKLVVNIEEKAVQQVPQVTYDTINPVNTFLPITAAELGSQGFLRHQRFTTVQFYPPQYNAYTGELRFIQKIRIAVKFNTPEPKSGGALPTIADPYFEALYQDLLINSAQASTWRLSSDSSKALNNEARDSGVRYRIVLDQDGIYELDYAALDAAGIPVDTLDPRTFQVFHQGEEVAIWVEGEADGNFENGDAILFFGEGINSKYTTENVYWLGFGEENGLRMPEVDGTPSGTADTPSEFKTTLHLEEDLAETIYDYYSDTPSGSDNDHLYWKTIWGLDETTISFEVANLGAGEHTLDIKGLTRHYYSNPQPHLQLYINDNPTPIFDGLVSFNTDWNIAATLQQSDLVEGTNTLTIKTTSANDNVLINRFKLDYYDAYFAENDQLFFDGDQQGTWEYAVDGFSTNTIQAYNLADPSAPIRIMNPVITPTANGYQLAFEDTILVEEHYLALTPDAHLSPLSFSLDSASNWRSATNGADLIIISHSDFLSALQPLVDYRESQGYRVALVDVQDVYDEFNGGVFSPDAIQSFLAYAFANWTAPAPAFVLLVGDGHWDYKDAGGTGITVFMPPYLEDVDPWIGETATDNAYVCVSGADNLPDMSIGRFPVSSVAEAQTMVQKVLSYEQNPLVGDWNTKLTFMADDADSGGDYAQISDDAIAILPPGYTSQKIYYKVNYANAANARTALINAINEGRFVVHYAGHGRSTSWASEELFRIADLSSLTNSDALPLVLPMTCSEGYFIWPGNASLGDSIVRKQGGGAIASFSPTGYGLSNGHSILAESILDQLTNAHYNQLGYLTTQAKYELFAALPSQGYLMDTYLLFGDPVLRLKTIPVELEAPTNLVATPITKYQVDLSWTDNSDTESAFLIERSPDGINGWTQIDVVPADQTTYSDSGLESGTTYYYRVRAYRIGDLTYSEYSNVSDATTINYPDPPTALSAAAQSTSEIDLTWVDNADDETAYFIERSPDGTSGWEEIDSVAADETIYHDTGLEINTTYFYRVRAYRASDSIYSPYSNIAGANTGNLPLPPTNLQAEARSTTEIDLTWTDNADDETAYMVERSLSQSSGWAKIGEVGADVTAFNDSGLLPGTTYYYRVRAYRDDDALYSLYSNTAFTMTIALPAQPTNLQAVAISTTEIDLAWEDNADDETAYIVERSLDGTTGWSQIVTFEADTTTYSDAGLDFDTLYYTGLSLSVTVMVNFRFLPILQVC